MEINGHEEITGEEIDYACDTRIEQIRAHHEEEYMAGVL